MSSNTVITHNHAAVLSVANVEAPEVVTSAWIDEQLAETYERTGTKPGLLDNLVGIHERRWWPEGFTFAEAAALAGQAAIDRAGISPDQIGLVISTSVCKDRLEPSIACEVHDLLGLPASAMNFDMGNACLAFVNAMHVAGTMIDAGTIDYALIVDGEGSGYTQRRTIERLQRPEVTAADVFAELASLTLGSGAAAMVLTHDRLHPEAHRIVGGTARAATQHNKLCVGDLDRMTTDTHNLLIAGLQLAEDAWNDVPGTFGWHRGMDHYIVHQVSAVHTSMLCERLGIDQSRVPLTFPRFGNIGPASVPFTLALVQDEIAAGERVLCAGIGSGLNVNLLEIAW
jgi:acyl-CoA:acyl-CoA alkyltransferase